MEINNMSIIAPVCLSLYDKKEVCCLVQWASFLSVQKNSSDATPIVGNNTIYYNVVTSISYEGSWRFLMIIRFHHAQIMIPKGAEEQGRQFYCHLLGLPEIEKPEPLRGRGGFWLQLENGQVHVGVEDGVERSGSREHLAYEVSDLETWRRRLQEAGIAIVDGVPIPGCVRFEFRDPFGNRVEFVQVV